jgi:hypothetical protein
MKNFSREEAREEKEWRSVVADRKRFGTHKVAPKAATAKSVSDDPFSVLHVHIELL